MTEFPTPGHFAPWAKLCPRTIQPGAANRSGKTGKGKKVRNHIRQLEALGYVVALAPAA